jgi:hypothetical protein
MRARNPISQRATRGLRDISERWPGFTGSTVHPILLDRNHDGLRYAEAAQERHLQGLVAGSYLGDHSVDLVKTRADDSTEQQLGRLATDCYLGKRLGDVGPRMREWVRDADGHFRAQDRRCRSKRRAKDHNGVAGFGPS